MKATPTKIPDVFVIEPRVFGDERGFFFESFNEKAFNAATGNSLPFVQDNHSRSVKGVLRGLHYQLPPKAQGKLVRVVQGEVFDVVVDVRKDSPTYGEWVGEALSADNKKQLWIPPGFAHGFLALEDGTDFLYKCTEAYVPEWDRSLRWNDPALAIEWPLDGIDPILSPKDRAAPLLADADLFE